MAQATTFDEIYRRLAPEIFRYALGLTRQRAVAEDITAETFARALTTHDPTRLPTVRAFLFTIAHRLVMDHFRRHKTEPLPDPDLVGGAAEFDRVSEQRDFLDFALRFLAKLPEPEREALLLRAAELSYAEIAATLRITEANAKVRVHRARLKLALWRAEQL